MNSYTNTYLLNKLSWIVGVPIGQFSDNRVPDPNATLCPPQLSESFPAVPKKTKHIKLVKESMGAIQGESSTVTEEAIGTEEAIDTEEAIITGDTVFIEDDNRAKISERDFTYQLWLPIFQKIFHINDEIIRIKVGETVLSESTESKASIYISSSNTVGFKVDMFFLLDFETEKFDLACAEAYISLFRRQKFTVTCQSYYGKIMQTATLNAIQNSSIYSWVIQNSGPSCSFYTVYGTKNQYHVCVHQFIVVFPKEYSELSLFLKSLSNILMFRDSLEATENSMKAAILKTRSDMDEGNLGASRPSTPTIFDSASIYHAPPPPHRDSSNSRMPEGIYFDEFTESKLHSSPGSTSYVHDTETDALGFVQNGEKWTNVLTGKTYSYNPYEL